MNLLTPPPNFTMPSFPAAPAPSATDAERTAFDDACRVYDLGLRTIIAMQNDAAQATREKQATAQSETAAAMNASVAVQRYTADAIRNGLSLDAEKRSMLVKLLSAQPVGINMTEAGFVKSALAQVEAIFAALPKSPATSASGAVMG